MRTLRWSLMFAVGACGGNDGPSAPPQLGPIRMTVVSGDAQSDTIGALLTSPIKVHAVRVDPVTLAETPAANQIVNFVVVEEDCGRAFAGSAITDLSGNAVDRWELGTKSGLCHMEVRTVDQVTGQPVVYATASATIKPGVAVFWTTLNRRSFFLSARLPSGSLIISPMDRKGNQANNPKLDVKASPGWVVTADSLFIPSSETTGEVIITSTNQTDTIEVTAVVDMRLHHWTTTTLKCLPAEAVSIGAENVKVDSVVLPSATVDLIVYEQAYLGEITNGTAAQETYLEWSGVATYYLPDNTTQTRQVAHIRQWFQQYYPFTISWGASGIEPPFTMTTDNPLSYSGDKEAWCHYPGWTDMNLGGSDRILTMIASP